MFLEGGEKSKDPLGTVVSESGKNIIDLSKEEIRSFGKRERG